MAKEPKLIQKQIQRMVLTPQMRQSLHLLELPIMELKTFLEEQIVENPLLEETEQKLTEDKKELEIKEKLDELLESKYDYVRDKDDRVYNSNEEERRRFRESLITKSQNLQEYILQQLRLHELSSLQFKIGEAIIGNLDENGYLRISIDEVSEAQKTEPQRVEKVLSLIQTLDPLGVGARNLAECLLLQLKARGKGDSLASQIIKNHLPELGRRKYDHIAKSLKVSLDQVKKAIKQISHLEPKPGRAFTKDMPIYIIPDIILKKLKDDYGIIINDEELPRLRINSYYKKLLGQKKTLPATKKWIREKLTSALWLIRIINQRQRTIRRMTEYIIKFQKEFLDKGALFLKPLTLKQVAQAIEMHPSTITRTVANKFVQTPYGIFALRNFFSQAIKTEKGGELSARSVKSYIEDTIKNEDKNKPLSDQRVVKLLNAKGINISRRTVTKYRKQLKLLPSYFRTQ